MARLRLDRNIDKVKKVDNKLIGEKIEDIDFGDTPVDNSPYEFVMDLPANASRSLLNIDNGFRSGEIYVIFGYIRDTNINHVRLDLPFRVDIISNISGINSVQGYLFDSSTNSLTYSVESIALPSNLGNWSACKVYKIK